MGQVIEAAVSTTVARKRLVQVIGSIGVRWLLGLLRLKAGLAQIPVAQAGSDLLAGDDQGRRAADVPFAAIMTGGVIDGLGGDFWLIDRRHRLWLARQTILDPIELRRVQGRHLYHRDPDIALIVKQLAA